MPPIPEAPVHHPVVPFDSDEESLSLLSNVEKTICYSNLSLEDDASMERFVGLEEIENPSSITILSRIWGTYYSALERRPLVTKSITAFLLMGFADFIAQMVEHLRGLPSHPFVDGLRVLRFAVFGILGAPWTHYYYDWLDTVLPPTPKPWTWTTAVKVAIDQFIQAPALLALIIMGMSTMEGKGIEGMEQDMEIQYVTTLIQNWKLWIPATIVNIAFVEPALRVLYDNLVFFVWTIFLSMILNSGNEDV